MNLDPRDVWRLQTVAERRGVKVAAILRAAIRDAVAGEVPATVEDKVGDLVDRGVPDIVIARRLGVGLEYARKVRRGMGLRPVKFRREDWEHELLGRDGP